MTCYSSWTYISNRHRIIPSFSPFCRLCGRGSPSGTMCHFLVDCRKKYLAWKLIWTYFFPLSPWSRHELQNSVQIPSNIFGCGLLIIWKAHWRFIFDSTPFCIHLGTSRSHSRGAVVSSSQDWWPHFSIVNVLILCFTLFSFLYFDFPSSLLPLVCDL